MKQKIIKGLMVGLIAALLILLVLMGVWYDGAKKAARIANTRLAEEKDYSEAMYRDLKEIQLQFYIDGDVGQMLNDVVEIFKVE